MKRIERLIQIFEGVAPEKRDVIMPLLHELPFLEDRLAFLKKQPMIRISKKKPGRQEATEAAKQYKETMQTYINAIKVLQMMLYREGEAGESPLMQRLKEFEESDE